MGPGGLFLSLKVSYEELGHAIDFPWISCAAMFGSILFPIRKSE